MLRIEAIQTGGAAAGLGLKAGDILDSINGKDVRDVIDYQFLASDEHLVIRFHAHGGKVRTLIVDKDPDDNLGIEFSSFRIIRCRNRCIFCFVDQMPDGCRKSLYIKDDDYRASFLYGNYITLGALSDADFERIFSQRLSPLYISVHTTDPVLRSFILRNKKTPDIMESMKRLAAGGIRMHTQIVLCPKINDGRQLQKTVEDLSVLFPAVTSIAVVPVGLTAFRTGLFPLRTFTKREARSVVDQVTRIGSRFKRQFGTRLVFASDEFYIKAGVTIPRSAFYEDFPQRENGVGMVAEFLRGPSLTGRLKSIKPVTATVVTGVSFSAILKEVLKDTRKLDGVRINQVTVRNRFFGPSVTVAGLLTGQDILQALRGKRLGDLVLVPANALKEHEDVFLDGMKLEQLGHSLHVTCLKVSSLNELAALLRSHGRRR